MVNLSIMNATACMQPLILNIVTVTVGVANVNMLTRSEAKRTMLLATYTSSYVTLYVFVNNPPPPPPNTTPASETSTNVQP